MSKRPDENEAPDMEAGMTTAERRRRRRRGGGLRVPSDNVPRRSPTTPPVVPPVPEDPNLAVSIAYSFASDASGPLPRADTIDQPAVEARPDTLTGDGPDVGDIVAPDAQATAVDLEEDDEPFEIKTREMTAVDLEELGLEDPSGDGKAPRRSGPISTPASSANAIDTIIVDDEDMKTSIANPVRSSGTITPPAAQGSSPALPSAPATPPAPPPSPPPRAKGPTPAPFATLPSTGVPFGTVPAPAAIKAKAEPAPKGSTGDTFGEDERSVEIEIEDVTRGDDGPTLKRAAPVPAEPVRVGRASTVALSDDDLEELLDENRSGRVKAIAKSGETVQLTDTDLEDVRERASTPRIDKLAKATKEESGEIVVDVVEEIDSGDLASPVAPQAVPITRASNVASGPVAVPPNKPPPPPSTTNPPPLGTPAADKLASGTSNPPPLGTPAHPHPAPPPTPPTAAAAKPAGDTHAPPPPPVAPAKAPPPAPGKKAPAGTTTAAAVAAAAKAPADKRSKRSKPWFEEIFDEDYLRTLPFLTPQATQAEAQFVVDALAVQPGAQLLDLGCGYGRHAMELAARGFHLVGLDLSLPLLLRGADEAQRRGLSINFVHADMRELDFDAQFDGVYCLFSTFGFFDDETNKKTASAVARALKPGGRCVIEVLNRDYVIGELPTRVWWEGDGCVVLEEVEFNYFSSRIHSNRSVVFDDGRQIEQEISIRAYSLHELGKLLHSAGFRVVEVSGSVHTRGRYFGNHSRHIIVVAEKKPKDSGDNGK